MTSSPIAGEREAKEREAFDQWWDSQRGEGASARMKSSPWNPTGYYEALEGWQARAALLDPVGEGWQPIETAPQGREMFVVKAFNVRNGFTGGKPYTSDPWCVWQDEPGKFARWPHNFAPTHWHALAASPKSNGGN